MSDTPRTDAFVREVETSKQDIWQALNSLQGFARHLERELKALRPEVTGVAELEHAIRMAECWLQVGEGVSLTYYHFDFQSSNSHEHDRAKATIERVLGSPQPPSPISTKGEAP